MRFARDLPVDSLSEEEFPRTWKALRACIEEGVAPGAVAGLWQASNPDRAKAVAVGNRRSLPTSLPVLPMEVSTLFDLASVSKIFATATLTALLVERRWIGWDTPVKAVFPDYPYETILVKHLLSHTAGYLAWEPYYERIRDRFAPTPLPEVAIADRQRAMREMIFKVAPEVGVGERALYSDISFLMLGFLIEEVTKLPLDRAVSELLWTPLGASSAHYRKVDRGADAARDDSIAATEISEWRGGLLQGQVHDDNTWAMGGYAGHAGVFADVRDLLHFGSRMAGGFLSRETLQAAWTRATSPQGCDRTLGWDSPAELGSSTGSYFSRRTVGHLGFTGTSFWMDLDAGLCVVLLTNRVHPTRENNLIRGFRPRFHDAVREDLLDLKPRSR